MMISPLALVFLAPLLLGYHLMARDSGSGAVRVSIIQPNVVPDLKWSPVGTEESLGRLEAMTRQATATGNPSLVVWPETAVPSYLRIRPLYRNELHRLVDSTGVALLTGAPDYEDATGKAFNSALLFRPGVQELQKYDKINLVPIGERIPFSDLFPILRRIPIPDVGETGFDRGTKIVLFDHGQLRFAVLICFESIFPDLVRDMVRNGADFVVNITNDGWFGRSSGPYQHAEIAVFRAIENRVGIARCANTGVSMVIDRCGRVSKRTGIFTPAILTESVQLRSRATFFNRYGNVFAMVCVLIAAGIVLVPSIGSMIGRVGRGRRRGLFFILPLVLGLGGVSCLPAEAGQWSAYTNMKQVNAVLPLDTEVWAATSGGVFRFRRSDSTYVVFRTLEGLADNNVLSIAVDADSTLWFGTETGGISRYSASTGRFLPTLTDLVKTRINALRFHAGRLFVGTQEGISLLEPVPGRPDRWQTKETYDALGSLVRGTEVLALTVFSGSLYAGTPSGLVWTDLTRLGINLLDPMSWRLTQYPGKVTAFAKADTLLLAASSKGVVRLVGSTGWLYDGILGVQGLAGDRRGSAYTGKDKSVYQRVNRTWRQVADLSSQIVTMAADSMDTLWVGTAGDGLKRLVKGREMPLPPLQGPNDNRFTDVVAAGDSAIWAVSNLKDNEITGPVMYFSGHDWQSFSWRNGLPTAPGNPVSVVVDQRGRPWVGTYGSGVAVRDSSGKWTVFDERNSALRAADNREFVVVNRMVTDRSGLIWMCDFTVGLAVFQGFPIPRSQLYTPTQDRLPSGLCTAIAIDANDVKWVGTFDAGFFLFDDGGTPLSRGDDRTLFFSTASSDEQVNLTSDKVSDIKVDRTGAVWVATDQGLNVMSGSYSAASGTYTASGWRVYTTADGLPSDVVTRLCFDPSGDLWVGTDGGLAHILPDGRVGAVFTRSNSGLIENDIAALAFRQSTGELMIGTRKGLSLLRVGASPADGTSDGIAVAPNPAGPSVKSVRISGLIRGDVTRIFTAAGELVKTLPPSSIQGGATAWNRLNESGYYAGSGIYYVFVTGETGRTRSARIALVGE